MMAARLERLRDLERLYNGPISTAERDELLYGCSPVLQNARDRLRVHTGWLEHAFERRASVRPGTDTLSPKQQVQEVRRRVRYLCLLVHTTSRLIAWKGHLAALRGHDQHNR